MIAFSVLYFVIISMVILAMAGWKYVCSASTMHHTYSSRAAWTRTRDTALHVTRWQHLQQSVEAADAVSELLLIFLHQRGGWRLHVARLQVLLRLWLTLMALRFSLDLVSTLLCCCHLNLNGMEELVWQISKIER